MVLSGSGKIFCAGKNLVENFQNFNIIPNNFFIPIGLDLQDAAQLFQDFADKSDVAQKCKILEKVIQQYQNSFTAIEKVDTSDKIRILSFRGVSKRETMI